MTGKELGNTPVYPTAGEMGVCDGSDGQTLRQHYAGEMAKGILAGLELTVGRGEDRGAIIGLPRPQNLVVYAADFADALLDELAKTQE